MTQTLIPMTAVTTRSFPIGVVITRMPMTGVDAARREFGPTLADAEEFVLGTTCTECGLTREDADLEERTCHDCGTGGCDCILVEDPHERDLFWCTDCQRVCLCRECNPDD